MNESETGYLPVTTIISWAFIRQFTSVAVRLRGRSPVYRSAGALPTLTFAAKTYCPSDNATSGACGTLKTGQRLVRALGSGNNQHCGVRSLADRPRAEALESGDFLRAWGGIAGLRYLPAMNTIARCVQSLNHFGGEVIRRADASHEFSAIA
jgi:hypothetical protein